jgi:hypothetical protein
MLLNLDGKQVECRLAFTSTEYNCSVKLVGKLVFQVKGSVGWGDIWVNEELASQLNDETVKTRMIQEFADYCANHSTYRRLQETSPYFPSDSGRYLPNYMIYADNISLPPDTPWYSCFKALIREFQNNPNHGFQVFELPMYNNNTYSSSFWPSKVWGIVQPLMTSKLYLKEHVRNSHRHIQLVKDMIRARDPSEYPKKDLDEIKKLINE